MKKLMTVLVVVILLLSLVPFAACNEGMETFEGEYRYQVVHNSGVYYGAKVTVETKKGEIVSIQLQEESATLVNAPTNLSKQVWQDEKESFLDSLVGKTAHEISAIKVYCFDNGEIEEIKGIEYLDEILLPCAHVILAIQDALGVTNKIITYRLTGEYKAENLYSPGDYYGVKVVVYVCENVIQLVAITSIDTDSYTNLSNNWIDKAIWEEGEATFIDSFDGMSVDMVNAVVVSFDNRGYPSAIEGITAIAGATQSSGRVILAVQNALAKLPK